MEASALEVPAAVPRISISAPLLRLRSDDQLVALFRAGSEEAFEIIHDRYRQRLFSYTRQMLSGSRQDAEDALQDVFVRAYAGLRASGRPISLKAWLYRVAHNRCIDQMRRPRPAVVDIADSSRSPLHDPIEIAERREDLRRLVTDVGRLPAQQRSVLLMRELDGLSYLELADAHGVTVPAVKSLLVRARLGLVEAREARDTACREVRGDLCLSHDRGVRVSGLARRHLRDCPGCREFRTALRSTRRGFGMLVPGALGPLGALLHAVGLGGSGGGAAGTGAAGGGAAGTGAALAGGSTATAGAGAATGAGVSGAAASGIGAVASGTAGATGAGTVAAGATASGAGAVAAGATASGAGAVAAGATASGAGAVAAGGGAAGAGAAASGAGAVATGAGALTATKVAAVVASAAVMGAGGAVEVKQQLVDPPKRPTPIARAAPARPAPHPVGQTALPSDAAVAPKAAPTTAGAPPAAAGDQTATTDQATGTSSPTPVVHTTPANRPSVTGTGGTEAPPDLAEAPADPVPGDSPSVQQVKGSLPSGTQVGTQENGDAKNPQGASSQGAQPSSMATTTTPSEGDDDGR